MAQEEVDSLFVPQQNGHDGEDVDDLFEDVIPQGEDEHDEDLDRAIAMSLEDPGKDSPEDAPSFPSFQASVYGGPSFDQPLEFNQDNAKAGRDFAHLANARAGGAVPRPFIDDSDDEDTLDLQAALAESRQSKHKPQKGPKVYGSRQIDQGANNATHTASAQVSSPVAASSSQPIGEVSMFDGPLPFESLIIGKSILSKKKKKFDQAQAGGFEREAEKERPAQPLPPWFSGDIREASAAQKAIEEKQNEGRDLDKRPQQEAAQRLLKRQATGEIIDLDAPKETTDEIIHVESSDDEDEDDMVIVESGPVNDGITRGDVAKSSRAESPASKTSEPVARQQQAPIEITELTKQVPSKDDAGSEDEIDWSESEPEGDHTDQLATNIVQEAVTGRLQPPTSGSPSPTLQDVDTVRSPAQPKPSLDPREPDIRPPVALPQGESTSGDIVENTLADEEDVYSDPEDAELMRQLAVEAEEHARFASTLNSKSQLQNAEDYEKELRQLRNQQKKDRRDADEVTHIMVTECQQLLKLFGLPYITAPMEAEAQCAELVNLGLVDGIVTDDSDIFLFGGTRVYKNMFNQAKFVECYLSSDLEKEYSLDRQKLIRFAHLLGSDYTEGLPNVGPVTALEILSEFERLEDFAKWWETVQMGQKLSAEDAANAFRRKFRKNATKLFLPAIFPDLRVDHAYLHPEVDSDPSPFQWGVPDLDALRSFLMATIGWSQDRTDEVLVPVIKDMNRRENEGTQANITQFFGGGVGVGSKPNGAGGNAFAPRRRVEGKSKRMETALGRLHQQARNRTVGDGEANPTPDLSSAASDGGLEEVEGPNDEKQALRSSRKPTSKKRAAPEEALGSSSESAADGEYKATPIPRKKGRHVSKAGKKANAKH